jgi:hypothetical protein
MAQAFGTQSSAAFEVTAAISSPPPWLLVVSELLCQGFRDEVVGDVGPNGLCLLVEHQGVEELVSTDEGDEASDHAGRKFLVMRSIRDEVSEASADPGSAANRGSGSRLGLNRLVSGLTHSGNRDSS